MRGVLSYEIESILHFIYLGQATIYQERMNEFLNVGKSLEIKEINKDIESPRNEKPDDVPSNEFEEEYVSTTFQSAPEQLTEIDTISQ